MDEDSNNFDYIKVLRALDNLPFNIGKNLLIDFLHGNIENESIVRNKLNRQALFGYLQLYSRLEIEDLIENLLHNNLIKLTNLPDNKFIKIIVLTDNGRREILKPSLYKKKLMNRLNNFIIKETEITNEDKLMFDAFDFFLKSYNEEQKKAIISRKDKILCVAGAGSGKTTALTKRIEFLTTFRSVKPENILAITFTRKARNEMVLRLSKNNYCDGVRIETFNSFCEKIIKQYDNLIYKNQTRMISYGEKIKLFKAALKNSNIDFNLAIEQYFTSGQRRDKTQEELLKVLMNDCYSILELYKTNNMDIEELKTFTEDVESYDEFNEKNIELVYGLCKFIDSFMKKSGFRDYIDQITHCIKFFKDNPSYIPKFEYVLIDEYQDINSLQIELIDLLNPQNLFCVGDPRQSIFGWRGSEIRYILNFQDKYSNAEIITLSTNYRSSKKIIDLINKSIENVRLPDLKHCSKDSAEITLLNFDSEDEEMQFVVNKVNQLEIPKNDILILARTKRIISELSERMKIKGINHLVKIEDTNKDEEPALDQLTLATIHSIKGLEAHIVFVIGCTTLNFPCKAPEHPIIDMINIYNYDKEEEERRLFYVALSRAKNILYLTYSGKSYTRFINQKMLEYINIPKHVTKQNTNFTQKNLHAKSTELTGSLNITGNLNRDLDILSQLKLWRKELSEKLSLPAYIIMHDKTLIELATKMPINLEELREISGIGPSKLERYGQDILNIINAKIV